MNRHLVILVFLVVLVCSVTKGQDKNLYVLSKAKKESITLRIAPADHITWQYGNTYGYVIERYVVLKDSSLVGERKPVVLTVEPLKPKPESEWQPHLNDDYVAVAAQAVYGEDFEVDQLNSTNPVQIYKRTAESEMRYSFALLAADLSKTAADLLGLSFEDKTALKGEKYLYKVFAKVPVQKLKVDTAFVFTGLEDYAPLPKPTELKIESSEGLAMVRWNTKYIKDFYTSYIIERSEDGKNFTPVTQLPIVNAEREKQMTTWMYKMDSIELDKKYYYRIIGLDPFGDKGPASDVVEVTSHNKLVANPAITSILLEDQQAKIQWTFPKAAEMNVDHFSILRSVKPDSEFEVISPALDKQTRIFNDPAPLPTNYYKVQVVGIHEEELYSFPFLFQQEDSIPPGKPTGVTGIIDTAGVVRLSWSNNLEGDLLGYRVLRSNFRSAEFSQITSEPVKISSFRDTIEIRNLSSTIYYRIQAVDQRYNSSEFSDVLELIKPDLIPPVPAQFKSYDIRHDSIFLEWQYSSSTDAAQYMLYRRKMNDADWTLIQSINAGDNIYSYVDEPATSGKYQYLIVVSDSSGLESEPSIPITCSIESQLNSEVRNLKAEIDDKLNVVKISWEYSEPRVKRFLIYRSDGGSTSLFDSVEGTSRSFVDKRVVTNTSYTYYIKAVFTDGKQSPFSKAIQLNYR